MRGLSEPYGSCMTIWMRRRTRRSSLPESVARSRPSNSTLPAVGGSSARSSRASVDLPEPDSPTIPSVSPFCSSRLTSVTACTAPTSFRSTTPRRIG